MCFCGSILAAPVACPLYPGRQTFPLTTLFKSLQSECNGKMHCFYTYWRLVTDLMACKFCFVGALKNVWHNAAGIGFKFFKLTSKLNKFQDFTVRGVVKKVFCFLDMKFHSVFKWAFRGSHSTWRNICLKAHPTVQMYNIQLHKGIFFYYNTLQNLSLTWSKSACVTKHGKRFFPSIL